MTPGADLRRAGRLFGVDLVTARTLASRLDNPRGGEPIRLTWAPAAQLSRSSLRSEATVSVPGALSEPGPHATRLDAKRASVRFPRVAEFLVRGATIHCELGAIEHPHLVELRFLGPVMAFWLELQGLPALHASAVVLGGRAVAFLSGNGGGKTSLAAALIQDGHGLLTDDVLAVEPPAVEAAGPAGDVSPAPASFLARPGYPQMRMWPRDAERFLGSAEGLERVHPRYSKLRVPVGEGGFGSFHHESAPLAAVYLVERPGVTGGGEAASPARRPRIEPLPPHLALIELVRHTFTPRLVEAAGLQPRRLERLARLVERVPVRRLVVPSGPGGLEAARDVVLDAGVEI